MQDDLLTGILDRALAEDIGLKIKTNNPHGLNNLLAEHRKLNPKWEGLMICKPSLEDHIFIVHKSVELDP